MRKNIFKSLMITLGITCFGLFQNCAKNNPTSFIGPNAGLTASNLPINNPGASSGGTGDGATNPDPAPNPNPAPTPSPSSDDGDDNGTNYLCIVGNHTCNASSDSHAYKLSVQNDELSEQHDIPHAVCTTQQACGDAAQKSGLSFRSDLTSRQLCTHNPNVVQLSQDQVDQLPFVTPSN